MDYNIKKTKIYNIAPALALIGDNNKFHYYSISLTALHALILLLQSLY